MLARISNDQSSVSRTAEPWIYTSVNNMKVLHNAKDVETYTVKQCDIWNVGQRSIGQKFIHDVRQSIHSSYSGFVGGLEYFNEVGDFCFLLIVLQQNLDTRQKKIALCHHKLSRAPTRTTDPSNVVLEGSKAFSWLQQRACDDLNLSEDDKQHLITCFQSSVAPFTEKVVIFSWGHGRFLQDGEANQILKDGRYNSSKSGWRYYMANPMESDNLCRIPELVAYSKSCSNGSLFLEHLSSEIKSLQQPMEFLYPLNFGELSCMFVLVAVPKTCYRVEMAIRVQFSDVQTI